MALLVLKQNTSKKLNRTEDQFWRRHYYASTSGTKRRGWRSSAISIATQSGVDWSQNRKTGLGAVFFIAGAVGRVEIESQWTARRWEQQRTPAEVL
jgi:hypothetical protein